MEVVEHRNIIRPVPRPRRMVVQYNMVISNTIKHIPVHRIHSGLSLEALLYLVLLLVSQLFNPFPKACCNPTILICSLALIEFLGQSTFGWLAIHLLKAVPGPPGLCWGAVRVM